MEVLIDLSSRGQASQGKTWRGKKKEGRGTEESFSVLSTHVQETNQSLGEALLAGTKEITLTLKHRKSQDQFSLLVARIKMP